MGVAVLKGGHSLQIDIANAEFMKAIGHGEQAEPDRNRDFYDCVYLQDAGAFEDMIEKCREQKRAEEIEVRIISGQGQICWVKFWCSIYYYKDAVPYYLLICKNTNDRKELEDELLLLNAQYSILEEVTDDVPPLPVDVLTGSLQSSMCCLHVSLHEVRGFPGPARI